MNSNRDECLKKSQENQRKIGDPISSQRKKIQVTYKRTTISLVLMSKQRWLRAKGSLPDSPLPLSRESFHLNLNFINRIMLYLSCLPFSWLSAWSQCLMCLQWWYFTILQSFSAHVPIPETKCKYPAWPLRYLSNISVTFYLKWPGNQDHNNKERKVDTSQTCPGYSITHIVKWRISRNW